MGELTQDDGLEHEVQQLGARIASVEERVEELATRLENIVDKLSRLTQAVRNLESAAARSEAQPVFNSAISPAMAHVLQLIYEGKGEQAQQELYALPEDELSAQPAVVMLAAAALFTQRGEYSSALTALGRARELTNDSRLLRVIQLLETQTR